MPLDYDELEAYISENVVTKFYKLSLNSLRKLKLKEEIISRKNPYLFKVKNIGTAEAFVRAVLDAYLSSQEETRLGTLLEALAIHICGQIYGGKKAKPKEMPSVDLEFVRDDTYYIVGIKSGPNWGNADQIARMRSNFKEAKIKLRAKGISIPIVAINGCIYGKEPISLKEANMDPELNYYKYCGQDFWELISGDPDLYVTIIHPLGSQARIHGPEFKTLYDARVNEMTREFSLEFLTADNQIDWEKIVQYVSHTR